MPAYAQTEREVLSETLFQEGTQLLEQGDHDRACPKLARSHKLDPAGGTVLLLALCYEQAGKTASAWVKFNEAIALARRDGRDDRVKRAREHVNALTSRLSRVTFDLEPETADLPGLVFVLDGTELPVASPIWSVPMDPGSHTLTLSAPGKRDWSWTFAVERDVQEITITVPALTTKPSAAPQPRPSPLGTSFSPQPTGQTAAPAPVERRPSNAWRTVGWVVGSAGLVSLGMGGYFGFTALSQMGDARDRCPTSHCSNRDGVTASREAADSALKANVLLGAGFLALGTGLTLILTGGSPSRPRTALVLAPTGSVNVTGTF
ncbi:type IV pilus biogenesis/stability protein PilW [Myxococcota bacterium]